MDKIQEESEFVVTEENFNQAFNNAGPLSRKRLLAKMDKRKMRGGKWVPVDKPIPGASPFAKRVGYVQKEYLPAADVEQYVKRFVLVHMNKEKA